MITCKLTRPGDPIYIKEKKRFIGSEKDSTIFAAWNGISELGSIANHYQRQGIKTTFKANSGVLEVETDKETYFEIVYQETEKTDFPTAFEGHWKDDDQELYNTTIKG